MTIYIIGEKHGEKLDKEFYKKAKNFARAGKFILLRENKTIPADKRSLAPNIYAIEDKVIWEYFSVIQALAESYSLLKTHSDLKGKRLVDLYIELPNNDPLRSILNQQVDNYLHEYTESLCSLLSNTKADNPVSSILLALLRSFDNSSPLHQLYFSIKERRELEQYDVTREEKSFVLENIEFFNSALKAMALLFREHLVRENYSPAIKSHLGLSEAWINEYFAFKFIRPEGSGRTLLNFDAVCVDLRNQFHFEQLCSMAERVGDKDIWYIVGEEHLTGLRALFDTTPRYSVRLISRDTKMEFMARFEQQLASSGTTVSAADSSSLILKTLSECLPSTSSASSSTSTTTLLSSTHQGNTLYLEPPQTAAKSETSVIPAINSSPK